MDIDGLLKEAREGNDTAREQLFGILAARFRLLARHKMGDDDRLGDVVQDALAVVSAEYGKLDIRVSLASWAHKVLDNRIRQAWQERCREAARAETLGRLAEVAAGHSTGLPPELRMRLLECMREICGSHRQYGRALNMRHQGYQTDEICDRLRVTPANLYSILSRARLMLKACLERGQL